MTKALQSGDRSPRASLFAAPRHSLKSRSGDEVTRLKPARPPPPRRCAQLRPTRPKTHLGAAEAMLGAMAFFDNLLDETHLATRDTCRKFAEREIAPHALEWEEAEGFPRELYAK